MRLFQNCGIYPSYRPRLAALRDQSSTFADHIKIFLQDRYGACHTLLPILQENADAFLTNGDDNLVQELWGKENGLPRSASLETILLAQIEHHRTEIFYNMDPMRYGSDFVRKLPSCVRKSITWRAAPSPGLDLTAYDLVVCNFPTILKNYRQQGWKAAYFAPAYDPEMDSYALNDDRPVDIVFVGGYSRHHRRRAKILEAIAGMHPEATIRFYLDRSRLTRLAESPVGFCLPLGNHRRPKSIRRVTCAPVFGRDLYSVFSKAKIVLNGAVDMAGADRGNLRCFEAMGCGATLLSDSGEYPEGMVDSKTLITWNDADDAKFKARQLLDHTEHRAEIAKKGHNMLRELYSKEKQWQSFQSLAS